jgi:hypothetical protein
MEKVNNLYDVPRPPRHERVADDLMIYALPNWTCPPDRHSSSADYESGAAGASTLVLSTLLVAVCVVVWAFA